MTYRGNHSPSQRTAQVAALTSATLAALLCAPIALGVSHADDLLPALRPHEESLHDHDVVRDPRTGEVRLRFTNNIANVGEGTLEVWGLRDAAHPLTTSPADSHLAAYQRIYRTDGSWHDEAVGEMSYHPAHKHFHFDGAARYELLDAAGNVVRSSEKVSFCLADVEVVDDSVSTYSWVPVYNSCAHNPYTTSIRMGVSPGWGDVYDLQLVGQSFDVTELMSLPNQEYILRSTTNPDSLLWETNQAGPASAEVSVWLGSDVAVGVGISRPGV
jgi:hypothetical protein